MLLPRALSFSLLLAALALPAPAFAPQGNGNGGGGTTPTPPPADASVAFRKDDRLCVARADATGQTVIGTLRVDGSIAWAGNGGPIVFQSPYPNGVWRINADGTGQTMIAPMVNTYHFGLGVTRGAPCPDGYQRAFYCDGPAGDWRELWSVRLDGTDRRQLTHNVSGQWYGDVSVSPSGDKLVVVDNMNDIVLITLGMVNGELAITSRQGLVWDDLTHPLNGWSFINLYFEDVHAANPNGTQILFEGLPDAAPGGADYFFRMDVLAPAVVNPLIVPQTNVGSPCTTRDGTKLFYVYVPYPSNQPMIYRANADGSGSARWADPGKKGRHTMPCTKP